MQSFELTSTKWFRCHVFQSTERKFIPITSRLLLLWQSACSASPCVETSDGEQVRLISLLADQLHLGLWKRLLFQRGTGTEGNRLLAGCTQDFSPQRYNQFGKKLAGRLGWGRGFQFWDSLGSYITLRAHLKCVLCYVKLHKFRSVWSALFFPYIYIWRWDHHLEFFIKAWQRTHLTGGTMSNQI